MIWFYQHIYKNRMAILLSKFRIDYSDLVIITDADEAPKEKTKKWFDNILQPALKSGINGLPYYIRRLVKFELNLNIL